MPVLNPQTKPADVSTLLADAKAFLAGQTARAASTHDSVSRAIQHAHQLVSPDLYVLEKLRKSGVEPVYAELLGEQRDEKIAAMIFLVKQHLLDIEHSTLQSRDIEQSRANVQALVEILYHVEALDALGIFFDFAAAQRESRLPALWRNVSDRSLYLMALLPKQRMAALTFLTERKPAELRLIELVNSVKKSDIQQALQPLLADFQRLRAMEKSTPAPSTPRYVELYNRHYEEFVPVDGAAQMASLLNARDRIEQAVIAGDIGALVAWVTDGSPEAMRETLRTAANLMSSEQYLDLLERIVFMESTDPVRIAVCIMELGSLNRKSGSASGKPEINAVLARLCMATHEERVALAKVAVRQLGSVNALKQLLSVVEHAPQLPVAEEAVHALADLRQLSFITKSGTLRPELAPVFDAAQRQHRDLMSLVESAAACPSDEMALVYLEQLRDRNAIPELRELCKRRNRVGELAQEVLAKINPALAVKYYQ